MFCKHCGKEIDNDSVFCAYCGNSVSAHEQKPNDQNTDQPAFVFRTPPAAPAAPVAPTPQQPTPQHTGVHCPKCGGADVDVQVHQENHGGSTVTKTKSKYREKGHGCMWWLIIGWWWWMVDLMLWLCIFPVRLVIQLFKKKKYVGDTSSVSTTKNKVTYTTVYLCKSCGHHWEK